MDGQRHTRRPVGAFNPKSKIDLNVTNLIQMLDQGCFVREGFKKKKKKIMEFSIKLAGWVLDDQVFHTLPYPPLTLKTIRVGIPRGVKGVS